MRQTNFEMLKRTSLYLKKKTVYGNRSKIIFAVKGSDNYEVSRQTF